MESVVALSAELASSLTPGRAAAEAVESQPEVPWSGLAADRSNWRAMAERYAAECIADLTPVARHISRHGVDGEDLLSEALERTMRLWAEGRGPLDNVNGYLVNSMRNRVIDERRSPRSQVVGIPDWYEARATEGDPEAEWELREQRDAIHSALMQLPRASRDLLIAVYVLDQKVGELAAQAGISANAVSARLSRAKRKLRDLLESDPRVDERYAA